MSVSLEQYLPLLVMTPEEKEKKYCVKISSLVLKGQVSQETVVLHQWASITG